MQMILVVCVIIGSLGFLAWAIADFRKWVALGIGGLPHNPRGWLTMSVTRLLKRDGVKAKQLQKKIQSPDDHAYLGRIVRRAGSRPLVPPYTIPQRQMTETATPEHLQRLQTVFNAAVAANTDKLYYAKSFYEKHNDAITLCTANCGHVDGLISHGEVAHIHPIDGSMHMVLSPSDAAQAIAAGWGELHGMAGFMNKLPTAYTFVYAPRSAEDLGVIEQLLQASVAHMCERRKQSV